jgi:hypothetical protein
MTYPLRDNNGYKVSNRDGNDMRGHSPGVHGHKYDGRTVHHHRPAVVNLRLSVLYCFHSFDCVMLVTDHPTSSKMWDIRGGWNDLSIILARFGNSELSHTLVTVMDRVNYEHKSVVNTFHSIQPLFPATAKFLWPHRGHFFLLSGAATRRCKTTLISRTIPDSTSLANCERTIIWLSAARSTW